MTSDEATPAWRARLDVIIPERAEPLPPERRPPRRRQRPPLPARAAASPSSAADRFPSRHQLNPSMAPGTDGGQA